MRATYRHLAAAFERLEETSSNTKMIDVLSRFLAQLSPPEVRMTAYLVSGRIGPSFAAPEFGMGQRLVAQAIASASGVPSERVERMNVKAGDLGTVAQELSRGRGSNLSIEFVFAELTRIAETSGAGSQRHKIERLAGLLRSMSSVEAKYAVRTVLGSDRIGVGEMTFLYALAKAFGASQSEKPALEYAYNISSDLGEVAFRASRSGPKSLSRLNPRPGTPVRMMLANRVSDLDEVPSHLSGEMFVEYKYDGERLQIHKDNDGALRAFSRRLEDITHQYPEVLAAVRKHLNARSAIIEGEVVAIDPESGRLLPFQAVMQRKRKLKIERYQKDVPVVFFAFDMLYANGKSLLLQPLSKRKALLEQYLARSGAATVGDFIRTSEPAAAQNYFRTAVARGSEGIVIKGASSPYQAGHRGWFWIKFKRDYAKGLADTFDLAVVGALHGKGSRAGSYGSLLVAAFDTRTNRYYSLTKVGAGITDQLLRRLPKLLKPYVIPRRYRLLETDMRMDVWFEPAVVVEIAGADLTISPVHTVARDKIKKGGIALRFPRLLRIRNDKTAAQATTVKEIWNMYEERVRPARARRARRRADAA